MSGKTFLWIEDCKGKSGYIFWSLETKENLFELVSKSDGERTELTIREYL